MNNTEHENGVLICSIHRTPINKSHGRYFCLKCQREEKPETKQQGHIMKSCSHGVKYTTTPDGRKCYRPCRNKVEYCIESCWQTGNITKNYVCAKHLGDWRPKWQRIIKLNEANSLQTPDTPADVEHVINPE